MIIALLLAAAQPLPDPRTNYPAYRDFTDGAFECDDRPYIKECGNDRERRQLVRFFMRDGGYSRRSAEEAVDWPLDRLMPQIAAVKRCGPGDVRDTAEPVTCNRRSWNPRTHRYEDALAELTRVDQAYSRIRHPTARQAAAYLRKFNRLSQLICPNGMNDNDGNGNVGCD